MILSRFQWYRRMRGGYWRQVHPNSHSPKWIRCTGIQCPTPDAKWTFYPWARQEIGNGYIDEWHSVEPCWAVPYSGWVAETIGTNDMACVLALIREARKAQTFLAGASHPYNRPNLGDLQRLNEALLPFANAKP